MSSIKFVVAHFDEQDSLSQDFLHLIQLLNQKSSKITIVSTSRKLINERALPVGINLLIRPNLGYDFVSYKVGFLENPDYLGIDGVIFINSSFTVLNDVTFLSNLDRMASELQHNSVVGLIGSGQILPHFQTHIFGVAASEFGKDWFQCWMSAIKVMPSKMDLILNFEVGFANFLKVHAVRTLVLHDYNRNTGIDAKLLYFKNLLKTGTGIRLWLSDIGLHRLNPSHFSFKSVLNTAGIVKNELLLTNPFNLPISSHEEISDFLKVKEFCSKDDSIAEEQLHLNLDEDVSVNYGFLKKSPIVVHFHVYYIDILDEFIKYLIRIPLPIDIFITTPFEDFIEPIIDKLAPIAQFVKVKVVPNKGRDVAPFLKTLVENNFKEYDLGLKLHTKKSLYSDRGTFWRHRILQGLLPDSIKIQQIFDLVQQDRAGIIGGSSEYLAGDSYWGSNSESYFHIANLVDFDQEIASSLEFFAGSMFWFNPRIFHQHEILKSILDTFESELGFQDGKEAHAFERLFCKFARDENLEIFGVDDLSRDISSLDLRNTIPVINS